MNFATGKPLILASDHSAPAALAAAEGLALAEALGVAAVMVNVVTPMHQGVDEAKAELDSVLSKIDSPVKLTGEVERALTVEKGLFQVAEKHDAGLIVIGTHGRTGLRHALVGSSAERIVQFSKRPVLTVHPGKKDSTPITYLKRRARILCPTDFSDASAVALKQAAALAKTLGAELVLAHVVEPILVPDAYGLPAAQVAVNLSEDLREAGESAVAERCAELAEQGICARGLIEEGVAWRLLTSLAESEDVDLVFMATRGLTGLEHFLLGSTAERVVRHCQRPVLSIKVDADMVGDSA